MQPAEYYRQAQISEFTVPEFSNGRGWAPYWCDVLKSARGQESNPEVSIQSHRTFCICAVNAFGQTVRHAEFLK